MLDWDSETNVVQRDLELMWNVLREENINNFQSNPTNVIQDLRKCLNLANSCKNALDQLEQDFLLLYEENTKALEANQAEIRKLELQKSQMCTSSHSGWPYIFGIPYFKGHDSFPAPPNQDAVEIRKKDYVTDINIPSSYRWKEQDKKNLIRAVTREIETSKLLLKGQRKSTADSELRFSDKEAHFSEEDYLEDISKLDWMKISTVDLKERHNTNECIGMWLSYLQPSINKNKWNKKEEEKLAQIAEKHNYQDWEKIAKELGTNRSAYQCIHHHQTRLNKNVAKKKWTEEENKKLEELVEHFRIGNFIPWNKIALCMEGRTKFQVYNHWAYTLHPSIKKGRFTKSEDAIILRGVKKYGADFGRISRYLPSRTSIQVRNRFNTFLQYQEPFKPWTAEEDEKLLDLVDKLGKGKWSQISKMFDNRNRTQIRHRYGAIQKWIKKNPGKRLNMTTRKVVANHCGPQKMLEVIENTKTTELPTGDLHEGELPTKLVKREHMKKPYVKPHVHKSTIDNAENIDHQLISFFKSGSGHFGNNKQIRYNKNENALFSQQVKMQLTVLCGNLSQKPTTVSKPDRKMLQFLKGENASDVVQCRKSRTSKVTRYSNNTLPTESSTNGSTSKNTLFSIPPNYSTLAAFKTLTSFCQNLDCNIWSAEDKCVSQELSNDKHSQTSKKGSQSNVHLKKVSSTSSGSTSPTDGVRDFQSSISIWKDRLLSLFFWPKIMSEVPPPTLDNLTTAKTTVKTKHSGHNEPKKVLRLRQKNEEALRKSKDFVTDTDANIHLEEIDVKVQSKQRKISKTSDLSYCEVTGAEKVAPNYNEPKKISRPRLKKEKTKDFVTETDVNIHTEEKNLKLEPNRKISETSDTSQCKVTADEKGTSNNGESKKVLRSRQKKEQALQKTKEFATETDANIHTEVKYLKLQSTKRKIPKISDSSNCEVTGAEKVTSNDMNPRKYRDLDKTKEEALKKTKNFVTNTDADIHTEEKALTRQSKNRKISKISDSSNCEATGAKKVTAKNNQKYRSVTAKNRQKGSSSKHTGKKRKV
ncbi:uncharacterized protein LOC126284666 [Schistocerca gregaria]|uniref:uncharacterized protein LOC126284666 n=1 Tax=Schistocerca gregaria TaxID=7010 RepID=UPI00211DDEBB|nr:uncharacterized protein LOC126284666 [Schistocerca gregaria]XP_049839740.1 uncharacterized protein LOC126284666 [Schistocerca gregaria]XP_049839750.1 uncharacterized protein LOC126284666 [Schistocerca gregaria]